MKERTAAPEGEEREARGAPAGFWPLQVGGWLAFASAMALGRAGEAPAAAIALIDGPFALLGFLATLLLQRVYAARRVDAGSSLRTLGTAALASYLAGMLWTATFHVYLHGAAAPLISSLAPGAPLPFRRGPLLDNTVYNTLTLLAWSMLYMALLYRGALREQREHALRAATQAREAQLQMLAYQLNPHFLFNALNSIRAMIDEDRARAREMVTQLAVFLRYSLLERPLHLAPLGEEVETLRGYLAIESIRFEDRLEVRIEVDPRAAECFVPAFLLNPLVENALKHGDGEPLHVRLHARVAGDRLRIRVENSGSLAAGEAPAREPRDGADGRLLGGGIGLRNVRARLGHHFPGDHRLEIEERGGWVAASLDVPAIFSLAAAPPGAVPP
jgi:hypothetical protein